MKCNLNNIHPPQEGKRLSVEDQPLVSHGSLDEVVLEGGQSHDAIMCQSCQSYHNCNFISIKGSYLELKLRKRNPTPVDSHACLQENFYT